YSGNPLACAAAFEAIRMINDPAFLARANEVGDRMRGHLLRIQQQSRLIGDVRGLGSMLLIEFVKDHVSKEPAVAETQAVIAEALKRGLVIIRAGLYSNGVRFLPPLNISDAQLDEGMAVVEQAVQAVEA
ncbi:MAG: aminotransferase class III-fold pyridoxal phosphate-dependent enzyme, partial [Anaerolinea sp.]|nr:aminotransferase class III-fold pyridoxal phosphate-dependent enzyme [Anaerolinea sp.]